MLLSSHFVLAYSLIYSDKQFERLAGVAGCRGLFHAEDLAIIRLTGGFVEY